MTLIIPTGFFAVSLDFTSGIFDKGEATVTFGVNDGALQGAQEVASDIAAAWDQHLKSRMSNDVTLDTVSVWNDITGVDFTVAESGGADFEGLPPNCALLTKKANAQRGRRHQGRCYWPGLLADTDVGEGGTIGSAQITAIQEDMDEFLVALGGYDVEMVILHNEEGSEPIPGPTPVLRLEVQAKIATQRRRLR
jgi:uncharacterized protein YaaQ